MFLMQISITLNSCYRFRVYRHLVVFNSINLHQFQLQQYLETQQVGSLLGDSGYGLKTFLLTPKLNPITQQEMRYNAAHRRGRLVVERAFGILKSRFRYYFISLKKKLIDAIVNYLYIYLILYLMILFCFLNQERDNRIF